MSEQAYTISQQERVESMSKCVFEHFMATSFKEGPQSPPQSNGDDTQPQPHHEDKFNNAIGNSVSIMPPFAKFLDSVLGEVKFSTVEPLFKK